jgi:hypothetical protein
MMTTSPSRSVGPGSGASCSHVLSPGTTCRARGPGRMHQIARAHIEGCWARHRMSRPVVSDRARMVQKEKARANLARATPPPPSWFAFSGCRPRPIALALTSAVGPRARRTPQTDLERGCGEGGEADDEGVEERPVLGEGRHVRPPLVVDRKGGQLRRAAPDVKPKSTGADFSRARHSRGEKTHTHRRTHTHAPAHTWWRGRRPS